MHVNSEWINHIVSRRFDMTVKAMINPLKKHEESRLSSINANVTRTYRRIKVFERSGNRKDLSQENSKISCAVKTPHTYVQKKLQKYSTLF